MRFPQDLPCFLYWVFFKPLSLYASIDRLDPAITNAAALLLTRSGDRSLRSLRNLALIYILVAPWLLALGTGVVLSRLGIDVNWLRSMLYLSVAIALSMTFSITFSIAFLLSFSVVAVLWNSASFTGTLGILFSLALGTAYGLAPSSARWGLIAALVYGVLLGLLLGPLVGLSISVAFLVGYFRILFYLVEAPLSWILGRFAMQGDALKLWQFHPVTWDELIWFPLPGLDQHLRAIQSQDEVAAPAAIQQVQESFRQGWAAQRILQEEQLSR